jgi:hypothetical protein
LVDVLGRTFISACFYRFFSSCRTIAPVLLNKCRAAEIETRFSALRGAFDAANKPGLARNS